MLRDIFLLLLFIFGVYYLLRNLYHVTAGIRRVEEALYPGGEEEMKHILIPNEWKEMKPLHRDTKTYRIVQWGTVAALFALGILFVVAVVVDLNPALLPTFLYLFLAILLAVKHPGNLYILPDGMILNGRYLPTGLIRGYKTEEIVRWHELYGLDPRINNKYKLTVVLRRRFFTTKFFVVTEREELQKIERSLRKMGIEKLPEERKNTSHSDSAGHSDGTF